MWIRHNTGVSSDSVGGQWRPRSAWLDHHLGMGAALAAARSAGAAGDVPVGAVVLDSAGVLIGTGQNRREQDQDPAGHAEVVALRAAAQHVGRWHLEGCTLYVTLEPCTMCAGAIVLSRVSRVVFGAWDEKAGAVGSVRDVLRDSRLNHQVEVIAGVEEVECQRILVDFFASRR